MRKMPVCVRATCDGAGTAETRVLCCFISELKLAVTSNPFVCDLLILLSRGGCVVCRAGRNGCAPGLGPKSLSFARIICDSLASCDTVRDGGVFTASFLAFRVFQFSRYDTGSGVRLAGRCPSFWVRMTRVQEECTV